MKKITMGLIGLMGLMGFIGCDKISTDEMTVRDGAVINWTAGTAELAPVQRVMIEKFTGPKCSNCPRADETLDALHHQYGDSLVLVSVNHPSGQGEPFSGDPDMRTEGGTVWDNYYGIDAIPTAFINRDKGQRYEGSMSTIGNAVATALQGSPVVALKASAQMGSQVDITVDLQFKQAYRQPLTLTVAIVEDSLVYNQIMPNYTIDPAYSHNHMLRKVVTGYWGRDIEADGNLGEKVRGTLSCQLPDGSRPENCHIVVFVSDKSSRLVLNIAQCKVIGES